MKRPSRGTSAVAVVATVTTSAPTRRRFGGPALRPECGGREHQQDAAHAAEQKIPRRGRPLKHWPQHLCRERSARQNRPASPMKMF